MINLWAWFLHVTGSDNVSGSFYGFWSGFGSDIGEIVLIGGIYTLFRRHNCHVKGCWRIGVHSVEGTPYIVCKRHHPSTPRGVITLAHVHDSFRRAHKKVNHA